MTWLAGCPSAVATNDSWAVRYTVSPRLSITSSKATARGALGYASSVGVNEVGADTERVTSSPIFRVTPSLARYSDRSAAALGGGASSDCRASWRGRAVVQAARTSRTH